MASVHWDKISERKNDHSKKSLKGFLERGKFLKVLKWSENHQGFKFSFQPPSKLDSIFSIPEEYYLCCSI